jgi:lipoyl(octanoyl) transferase
MAEVKLYAPGILDYQTAWDKQKAIYQKNFNIKTGKVAGETSNHLFLLEHPPVYTLGKSGDSSNLLLPEKFLKEKSIGFYKIERGGDITFHGPGQWVGYPLLDLEKLGVSIKDFIDGIEEMLIRTVARFGIKAARIKGATGVWVEANHPQRARKIAAIGMKISKMVTMHGFALNVNTDLKYFDYIIPCGIRDKGVTSIQKETGKHWKMEEVKTVLLEEFAKQFDIHWIFS